MSKSRSLPLTELANLLGLPVDEQAKVLRRFVRPAGKLPSYNVAKECMPEATAASLPMFPGLPGLTGTALWEYCSRKCKGDEEKRDFNWPIIESVSRFSTETGLVSLHRKFDPVPLVGTHRTKLVSDILFVKDGRPALVCLDPRKMYGLSSNGILVVQSLIHWMLRENYPELAECDVWIMQFPMSETLLSSPIDGKQMKMFQRNAVVHSMGDAEPLSWHDLQSGLQTTLRLFAVAVEEAAAERRKKG